MTSPFLTIAEASEKTGRSHSTLRRLIKTIVDAESHPDRDGIEPSIKEVENYKKKGENFTWKIREDVLVSHLPPAQKKDEKSGAHSPLGPGADVLEILRRELDLKNQQIEKQWEVIGTLNERLREGNILMGSLQQRLSLPHPEASATVTVESPAAEASMEDSKVIKRASKKKVAEAKQALTMKGAMNASVKSSKKGVLAWLFK